MSVRPALPNLLDDLISREDISRLLARLRELRRRIFEAWIARHQSRRLEQGVERTIDEACIYGGDIDRRAVALAGLALAPHARRCFDCGLVAAGRG